MNPIARIKKRIAFVIIFSGLFLLQASLAQYFQIRNDVMDNSGGKSSSANFSEFTSAGQTVHPGFSQSASFQLSSGFLSAAFIEPAERVAAHVICPAGFAQNCSITAEIKIDMTNMTSNDSLLRSFSGSLTWDTALIQFVQHSALLSGFVGDVDVDSPNGIITFSGTNTFGSGGLISILNIDFEVIGSVGSNGIMNLDFSLLRSISQTDLLPFLNIKNCSFTIVPPDLLGDVNDDNLVNSTDALIILSFDAGLPIPSSFQERILSGIGDTNSDGFTNSTDALIIISFDVGINVSFPVGNPVCP